MKFDTSASFRAISKTIVLLNIYLDLNLKTPSHVTILIWAKKKTGIYFLNSQKEKSDDWIILIDESVEFGNDKLLVILGIREAHIDFSRPLNYQDVTCLKLIASSSWTGEQINEVINGLTTEIGNIKYAVADMGNAIKKALRLASIPHAHDINHKLSWFIKELLKDDTDFQAYSKKLARLRGSMPLSKVSYILPPQQRVHSRFMNLKPIFDWGESILELIKNTDKILCSSDILESSFGKYKNYISKNKSVGITDLSLTIPAFLGKHKNEEITKALESVKTQDIKQWGKDNMGESLTRKRQMALKMEGRKKMVYA